jgi:hypothetical protein
MEHQDAFPRPRLNARCRFSQGTFAGARGNGREAPKAAVARERPSPLASNAARPLKATLATDEIDNRSCPFMSMFQKQGEGQRRMPRLVACFRPICVPRGLARCCSQ